MENKINKQKSYQNNSNGKLYLVPTPIGNLEDMTYRSISTLKEVDLIASEDTRNTQKLLNHFTIKTNQVSLHEHNYKERIPELLNKLLSGHSIAQVSDAGMPSISDPGHELVVECIKENIDVIALPGATAGVTSLIASGASPQPFMFFGFLPKKQSEIKKVLNDYLKLDMTFIFYESPHRITKTLTYLSDIFSQNNYCVVARELTKIHEEYLRGSILEVLNYLNNNSIKGEICLIIENKTQSNNYNLDHLTLVEQVDYLINHENLSSKDAIKKVAQQNNLRKQDVYQKYHNQ